MQRKKTEETYTFDLKNVNVTRDPYQQTPAERRATNIEIIGIVLGVITLATILLAIL